MPDDIPAQLCTALAEDKEGFLWMGTQGGLVRYDGYAFRVFRSVPEDSRTLGGSYIRTLLPLRDGRLGAGTFSGGLSIFDPATETFQRLRHDPGVPHSLAHDRVEALAEDEAGRLWVGTDQGLDRLERDGTLRHFRHTPGAQDSLADDRVRSLYLDRSHRLWVGTRGGLQVWLGEGEGFRRFGPPELWDQLVTRVLQDSRGRLWVGTWEQGAWVLDADSGAVLKRLGPRPKDPKGLSHFWVYGLTEVEGEMWIATFGGGIDRVDSATLNGLGGLRHDPALADSIGGDRIGALLRDRAGTVWVGTWGEGLAFHHPSTRAIQTLRHSPRRPEGLSHPSVVRALERRNGEVWVGTNGNGIDILTQGGRRRGGYRPDPKDPGALSDGSVTCLAEAPDGTFWVATLNGVLHRLPPGSSRFQRLSAAEGLPRGAIRAMAFAPDGALWLGAAEGMARLQGSRLQVYRHDPEDDSTLSGNAVEALAFMPDGTLWVGTSSGLNAFDPRRGTAVRVLRRPEWTDGLPDNWVPDLLRTRDGRLWVATQGGACLLASWDGREARFESLATKLGRPALPVESLIEDAEGWVWLGPRLRVDPRSWQVQEWGPAEGCAFRNFYIASRAKGADGRLYFGSPEGLLVVDPQALHTWTRPTPLVVTSLAVGGVVQAGANGRRTLVLGPSQRAFRMDFAALDLTAPQRLRYRYRLEGSDPAWVETDSTRRSLSYASLRPGPYILRIQASNRQGVWNPQSLEMTVKVMPAFYQTLAFRTLCGGVALALLYTVYQWRVRRLEARSLALEVVVAARTSDLAAANAELARSQQKIAELMAASPDLLENLEGWTNRMIGNLAEFAKPCRITVMMFEGAGIQSYGPALESMPSLTTLASLKATTFTLDKQLLIPARGPSGELVGVVLAQGGSLAENSPLQQLLEGFAHQFGAAVEMLRIRKRLHAVEANQAKTLQEYHARGIATLQVCATCGRCFDHTETICPQDGGRLEVPRALPFRFLGRYRFLRCLGAGGMGAVYAAEDEQLNRWVAIKLIRPELVSETALRIRFEREAQAIAKVHHPGVVTLYDSGSTPDGQLYLIMEHLKGLDVASALRQFGKAHPAQAARFIRQGAAALQAAHEARVIHRDLKPQNLFLVPHPTEGFQLKVLDFGLAKRMDSDTQLTRTGLMIGTPQYMAPEQVFSGETEERTDLYALAAVAYEVLTRKPVVSSAAVPNLLRGIWAPAPQPPSTLVPSLEPVVDRLFAQALAERLEDRPKDLLAWAEELAGALERATIPGGWPDVIPLGGAPSLLQPKVEDPATKSMKGSTEEAPTRAE